MSETTAEQRNQQTAYAIFRLTMGINIFLHGATRILSGVGKFADAMSAGFKDSPLPSGLTWAFLAALPFMEALVGLLLILGLWTRPAVIAGSLLMTTLVFGTALRSDWAGLGLQMVYVLSYYFLISHATRDAYGLDAWRARRRAT
jgi:thiosulfate dehydrogenase [quinone] large subunit